jgi:release factor glutamine methyltransferase
MTITEAIQKAGVERLDAEVLLAHALTKNRTWLLTHGDERIPKETLTLFQAFVKRRKKEEPVAYIVGHQEFFGRNFLVTPDVLIPRPATEGLIEATLRFLRSPKDSTEEVDTGIVVVSKSFQSTKPEIIVDIGTGSGCIAITLACEGIKQNIIGVDISSKAIEVAKGNAQALCPKHAIEFIVADGIDFVRRMDRPFLLVSNPPYIPAATKLPRSVADFEPSEALFAGSDGLSVLQPLIEAARKNSHCTGFIVECRADQNHAIL